MQKRVINQLAQKTVLLKDAAERENPNSNIALQELTGINTQIFNKWMRGDTHGANPKNLKLLCGGFSGIGIKIEERDFSNNISKYEFGEKLGYNWAEVQAITDSLLTSRNSATSLHSVSEHEALELVENLGGVYHIYYPNEIDEGYVVRSVLRIRYTIKLTTSSYVVRAALYTPFAHQISTNSYSETKHDGVVFPTGGYICALLEERKKIGRANTTIIYLATSQSPYHTYSGLMTRIGQNSLPLASKVVAMKIPFNQSEYNTIDEYKNFINDQIGIFDLSLTALPKEIVDQFDSNKLLTVE